MNALFVRSVTLRFGAALLLASAVPALAQQERLFRDSFEARAVDCALGPAPANARAGRLGPAPDGPFESLGCFEIANDRAFDRPFEIASGGLAIPRAVNLASDSLDRLVVVATDGARLAAQFRVLSRWGGPLADAQRPVRWLEVITPAAPPADSAVRYELRRYATAPTPVAALDPWAVQLVDDGSDPVVDTGVAAFVLGPSDPAVLRTVDTAIADAAGAPRQRVLTGRPGDGPRLGLDSAGMEPLSTARPGTVTVESFSIEDAGPVRARAVVTGRFSDPSGTSLCTTAGVPPYAPFGYTATLTWTRASRDVALEWILRNECSDAFFPPWTDDTRTWREAGWRFPAPAGATLSAAAGLGAVRTVGADVTVEQRTGAFTVTDWLRRFELRDGGAVIESGVAAEAPLVARASPAFLTALQMPWMRFREPQALRLDAGGGLEAQSISRPRVIGEGKGLWTRALLQLRPAGGDPLADLAALRETGTARLERPLTPRWTLDRLNAAAVLPPLAIDTGSAVEEAYRRYVLSRHENTVRDDPSGQWWRFRTYGAQLWPDTQANDLFAFPDPASSSPFTNSGAMNYWNPSGAEALEFLRSGEPRWLWGFAQPQAWLQLFTARMNIGARDHGARNGVAVTSGGTGEGQWHRAGFGSDDYTYNAGMQLHYALRPTPAMRERFRHGGRMIATRYSVPWNPNDPGNTSDPNRIATQTDRDRFFNAVAPLRGNVQHFELLANCAEFVPGPDGQACNARLIEILTELAGDNLRAGLLCQDDVPVDNVCDLPQSFMTSAMMYGFLLRAWLNWGEFVDRNGQPALSRTLTGLMPVFYEQGMAQQPGGGPDASGDWAYALGCDLVAGGDTVGACQWFDTGDGLAMFRPTKPHTVALGLIGDAIQATPGMCDTSRRLLDELFAGLDPITDPFGPLADFADATGGWWKGASQAAQMLVFAIEPYAGCATR
ncbi:hypothetical protein HFP89_00445 [Wenzhouxiangella sp. XN79A]|uniref:hypothetical protein n=1 Tax=Wenzhouxiangella sp. XN79A TaxID=2724193 RepID=UPI00144ADD4D|nr:hypothetical protein [Wenzhouxiangella sp. XN79A]NKI33632.1 hypothetical protein [Wenzhouxiangella sp. XN79A]